MTLKGDLQNQKPIWCENWQPFALDITAENIKKFVSPCLFNFMAWLMGLSDDREGAQYIILEEKTTAIIFSLCQDLIYIAYNWRVQTPKSLALAIISFL